MSSRALADNTVGDHTCDHLYLRPRRWIRLSPGYDDRTLAPIDDAELLSRVADRDRRALEVLYERHAGWLQIRLEKRCGDPELADLALQDAFLSVWKSASSWRGDGEVAAWMWGIAVRRLVDILRREKRRPKTNSIDDDARSSGDIVDNSPTPEDRVVANANTELTAAINDLPTELFDVIIATTVDGLSNREAAALLGIPVGTLKTRARRARALLQGMLDLTKAGSS